MPPKHPIIAIAYSEETRQAFVAALEQAGAEAVAAASFYDAETLVLSGSYSGLLVDLPSIVKAKGDEKVVACSLTNFFPTLRVRAVGSVLVPMTMPGAARQDNSLDDFLAKSCSIFEPRRLRHHRRREIIMAAQLHGPQSSERSFIINLSWGGLFLLHSFPERFTIGDRLDLYLPEAELLIPTCICWLRPWGDRRLSGLGLQFSRIDDHLHEALTILLKSDPAHDRDRLVA